MNKQFLKIVLILLTVGFISCGENGKDQDMPAFTDKQLGQLIVVGFKGTEINAESPIVKDIKEYNIGGVLLYDYDYGTASNNRNIADPDQLLQLNSSLVGYSSTPPVIAVSHDGSENSALFGMYPEIPNVFGTENLAKRDALLNYARTYAQEFMVVGINTNLHPRLGLNTSGKNSSLQGIISDNPEEVVSTSNMILDEYDTEKLLSVPKYFPGYSSDYKDTDTKDDVTEVWTDDFLSPYKELLANRTIRAIQTSHSLNSNLDSEWPGTFSENTINGLLRDSLGFEGVVFSDDLQKPIITARYDLETTVMQSINAGVDILVFGNNHEFDQEIVSKVIGIIQKLLKEGKISEDTIQKSLERIDQLKQDVIAELCTCLTT